MISRKIQELVQEIFLQIEIPSVHQEVREDPGTYLISLLREIKEDISGYRKYRVPLHSTVERACFDSNLEEARKLEEPVLQE